MDALYDHSGRVYAWIDRQSGRIVDLKGRHIAFVDMDSVYNWRGRHVAWWHGDHIRNQSGKVAVFLKNAVEMGVDRPSLKPPPPRPPMALTPSKPGMAFRPAKPQPAPPSWAAVVPF
jgi:hypothetical protein